MAKYGFVIAGTHSGCGKTTMSLALMAYFTHRGFSVQPFKVGPDFIDPGLHGKITGRISRNLDGWMLTKSYNTSVFEWASSDSDIAIVEGVMGVYDGFDGKTESGSTAQMAKWINLPVILVIDARSMARSVAALVHGFTSFDPKVRWAGIILNRVGSEKHFRYLRDALLDISRNIPILGWIPVECQITLPERHLGLITAEEGKIDRKWIQTASSLVEQFIDVDLLLERSRIRVPDKPIENPFRMQSEVFFNVTVGIPRDAAFCFYYMDNIDIMKETGARIVEFSPLKGEIPPDNVDALYLGGGYPEVHVEKLSGNYKFFEAIRSLASRGTPIYAECGGLMTLGKYIRTLDGKKWPMAGILPFGVKMLNRRKALGYVEVKIVKNCILGSAGSVVRGHEFHYSDICADGNDIELVFELYKGDLRLQLEGYARGNTLASYVHQHWGSNPYVALNFLRSAFGA